MRKERVVAFDGDTDIVYGVPRVEETTQYITDSRYQVHDIPVFTWRKQSSRRALLLLL